MTTIEEYKSAVINIVNNIDGAFIGFRGNAHDVDPDFDGGFMDFDHRITEKEWILGNIKLEAPIQFEIILHADEYYTCQSDFDTLGMQYLNQEFEEMHDPINCGWPVTITIDYQF